MTKTLVLEGVSTTFASGTVQVDLQRDGANVKAGLTPADLAANEFIDKSIKLS